MRILIVDDERLICEWIQFCIRENPEYEICGVANNGEQALRMYHDLEPDLVLSDIKMPVMDGLTLLREIKKINNSALVVLLTAFSEFDYVREAMREEADEYILKTEISNQSFQEMLQRISVKLQKRTRQSEESDAYAGQKSLIIHRILTSERSFTEEDLKKLRECNVKWSDTGLFAAAVWKNDIYHDFLLLEYENILHVKGFEYDEYIYVFVGNLSRNLSDLAKINTLNDYINHIVTENHCMIGSSTIKHSLAFVKEAVNEAVASLAVSFYKEHRRSCNVCETATGLGQQEEKQIQVELKHRYQAFYTKTGKEQYLSLEEIFRCMLESKPLHIKYIKTICKECLDVIYCRYTNDNTDFSKETLQKAKAGIDQATVFNDMKEICLTYAKDNIWNQDINDKELSQNIFKAVLFIQQHFNEPINLEQIAQEANLNPEYLSRVFKEETGYTYSTFLSNIRMKKAEYLLINTLEKVQNIAENVGYTNVSYFSTIFKKKYGLNPYEFRRNHANQYISYDKKL